MNLDAFKAYDIRGLYPTEVNKELALLVGYTFPTFIRTKAGIPKDQEICIAIGGDMRISTPELKSILIKALSLHKVKILDLGMCTTPMLNFIVNSKKLDGGIMITASHNPKEYNAFKLIGSNGVQISEDTGLKEIKTLVQRAQDIEINSSKDTDLKIEKVDILQDYLNHLFSLVSLKGTKKVVLDCGNGVGGISAVTALQQYCKGTQAHFIYDSPNGQFPNHNADPHDLNNFKDLQSLVLKEKADLGVFFDGDADRAYFVDEKGAVVMADIAVCAQADYELKNKDYKSKVIYHDLRFTKAINDVAKQNNARAVMLKVGNPFYKQALKNKGGVMAAELAGHTMYIKNYCIDDALFATLKMLEVLESTNLSFSDLAKKYVKYATGPEMSFKLESLEKSDQALKAVKNAFNDGEFIELDGVYIQYSNWWFNLRKSGTEPKVRLRVEASTKVLLEQKTKQLLDIINSFV
jgi:phosphomannomutase